MVIVVVLLYDVVEDIDVMLYEFQDKFGVCIIKMVDGLIKFDGVYNFDSL